MRNSCIAKGSGSVLVRYAASLVATIVAKVLMGCSESPSMMSTVSSPVIPFDTLFQLEDTIRLDPKILIGNTGFMDVDECLPDDAGIFPLVARAMGRGRTLVVLASKSAAIFTADGKCLAGKRELFPYAKSYCVQGDTIVTHNLYTGDRPEAGVFTSALKALPGIAIAPPRFVVLDYTYAGQLGRTIECFHDGPYYIYNESMDAIPVHRTDSILRHRPAFFTERPKDLPIGSISKRAKARAEHPSAIGVFALDGQTRMVVYVDLESSWKHDYAGMPLKIGLSVASNTGAFPGRSTVAPVWPIAAANGFLYAVGENGNLPSGDVGNPFVVRYRHTPPKMGEDLARGRWHCPVHESLAGLMQKNCRFTSSKKLQHQVLTPLPASFPWTLMMPTHGLLRRLHNPRKVRYDYWPPTAVIYWCQVTSRSSVTEKNSNRTSASSCRAAQTENMDWRRAMRSSGAANAGGVSLPALQISNLYRPHLPPRQLCGRRSESISYDVG